MLSLEVWFLFYRATCIYLNPQTEAKVKNLGFRILKYMGRCVICFMSIMRGSRRGGSGGISLK